MSDTIFVASFACELSISLHSPIIPHGRVLPAFLRGYEVVQVKVKGDKLLIRSRRERSS